MISICFKSINKFSLNLIENDLDNTSFPDILYSQKKFKYNYVLIIHYIGNFEDDFYDIISEILLKYISINYEKKFIRQQLLYDYFYFSEFEKKQILADCISCLSKSDNILLKKNSIKASCINYFSEHHSAILEGFISFRLTGYKKIINTILETTINEYVIKKEYSEYVHLLRDYVISQIPQCDCIHLIYGTDTKILLDSNKNLIANSNNSQVYLSDISFSSNDFILNTLLSLLPNKVFLHLHSSEDNFIKFLKLIFDKRLVICENCNLCKKYLSVTGDVLF